MKYRGYIACSLVAALLCVVSIFFLVKEITSTIDRVHSVGSIRLINFSFKAGRNFDELAHSLFEVRDCRVNPDRLPPLDSNKEYVEKFDIVWSAFKNAYSNIYRQWVSTGYWVDEGRASGAVKIRDRGLAFVDKYESVMSVDKILSCSEIDEILHEIYDQKQGITAFAQEYSELDNIAAAEQREGAVKLYNNILFLGVSFFITMLLTVALLYKAIKEAEKSHRLSVIAGQQAVVALDDLRESVAKGVAQKNFFAAASHDLRQPLHALGLYLGSLGKHVSGADAQHILSCASLSTESLSELLDSLLDISKLDAGVIQSNKTEFEVSDLLSRIYRRMLPVAIEKRLELICNVQECWIYSDQQLLDRILQNLLANALTYTEQGQIEISCANVGQQVIIEIADTGCGIPELQQEAIFNEFYQLHNHERDRGKGLGLGLSIVRRLSDLLGINLKLKSRVGRGTTFTLSQSASGRLVAQAVETNPREPTEISRNLSGVKILLVDDDRDIRDGTVMYLQGLSIDARASEDETDAVSQCIKNNYRPDLIIADYRLRDEKTGIQAIIALREIVGQQVPAIIVTGDTTVDFVADAQVENTDILYKPVDSKDLLECIGKMLPGFSGAGSSNSESAVLTTGVESASS